MQNVLLMQELNKSLYINDYEPDMTGIEILRDSDVSVIKLVDNSTRN